MDTDTAIVTIMVMGIVMDMVMVTVMALIIPDSRIFKQLFRVGLLSNSLFSNIVV